MIRNKKYLIALIIIVVIIVMFKMLPLWVTCLNLVSFGVGCFLGYKYKEKKE